jgi:type III secretory pathway component EscS
MWKKYRFFTRIGKTRIIPIGFKILLIFICLILLSNFTSKLLTKHKTITLKSAAKQQEAFIRS